MPLLPRPAEFAEAYLGCRSLESLRSLVMTNRVRRADRLNADTEVFAFLGADGEKVRAASEISTPRAVLRGSTLLRELRAPNPLRNDACLYIGRDRLRTSAPRSRTSLRDPRADQFRRAPDRPTASTESHTASAGFARYAASTSPSCVNNGRIDPAGTGYELRSRSVNVI